MNTLENLVSFVNEQPKDREINHLSYETCVLGDFAESIGMVRGGLWHTNIKHSVRSFAMYEKGSNYLPSYLGFAGTKGCPTPNTYGEVQEWLVNNPQGEYL